MAIYTVAGKNYTRMNDAKSALIDEAYNDFGSTVTMTVDGKPYMTCQLRQRGMGMEYPYFRRVN